MAQQFYGDDYDTSGASAGGAGGGGGLLDLMALFNSPYFRAGQAYNYGQAGTKQLGDTFQQQTANQLAYIQALSRSMPQHANQGGNVPAPQLKGWDPALISQLIQLLGAQNRGG